MKAKIIGTGSYLPKKVLTNFDLQQMVDTSDEWIVSRTGIKQRRIAEKDENVSDLGYNAAKEALKEANLQPKDIDLIIVATLLPDYIFPSAACILQNKLGATNAAAFDFQAACSGFVYGLNIARAFVEKKIYKNVLIVAAEKLSSIVNYQDRSTCILFGDGAGACVVSLQGNGFEIDEVVLGSDGSKSDLLIMPGGGSKHPATYETVKNNMHYIHMEGNEVFKYAVRKMESASKQCLEKANLKEEDISWLIPHQANDRIISTIAKRFKHLPENRIFRKVVEKYGNTSASSIIISLDELKKSSHIKNNEKLLFTVFGAGFTWGSVIITKKDI